MPQYLIFMFARINRLLLKQWLTAQDKKRSCTSLELNMKYREQHIHRTRRQTNYSITHNQIMSPQFQDGIQIKHNQFTYLARIISINHEHVILEYSFAGST